MLHQHTQEATGETKGLYDAEQARNVASQLPPPASCVEAGEDTQADTDFPLAATASATATSEQTLLIKRLRRKLFRRSFLPQRNAYLENPGPLSPYKFAAVLGRLCDPAPNAWRERMLCAWLLGHAPLTSEQQREAARALGKVAQNRHAPLAQQLFILLKTAALQNLLVAAVPTIWLTCQLFWDMPLNRPAVKFEILAFTSILYLTAFVALFPLATALPTTLTVHRTLRIRIAAILALARLRIPEAVSPLARATVNVNPNIRSAAEEGLRQCLPQITPDHYARLDADTVPALCRLLDVKKERLFANHAHTEQLVLDVLAALGKIGDGSAARHVESVAEDGWTQAVRDAAREILPLLRERRQQENNPRLLLRGSAPPQTTGDQLLRPTSTPLIALPEQLLRPISAPKREDKGK